jgi:hypothetical protein
MTNNVVLIIVSLLLGGLFLHPRLLRARMWRATVTPLASIIGSGFLVAAPILSNAAGRGAWLAMLLLCALAYLFGAAIRHNILHVETKMPDGLPFPGAGLERASDLALSLAYFVSVSYYLNLFAAFGLRLGNVVDPFWIDVAATAAIAAVGIVGAFGGLKALERLEVVTVGVKLSVIGGILAALSAVTVMAIARDDFAWPQLQHAQGDSEIRILLGLVILVQGFETSRYLGSEYDSQERVKSMRWAQWISTGVYVVFILLTTSFFTEGIPAVGGETAIIEILRPIGSAVGPVVILAALASQSSAAIADMNGASGLLTEATRRRISVKLGNLITAMVAIIITWTANIYEIITYASKAFVLYYALQSLQAALSAGRKGQVGSAVLFTLGLLAALAIVVFAVPAEA